MQLPSSQRLCFDFSLMCVLFIRSNVDKILHTSKPSEIASELCRFSYQVCKITTFSLNSSSLSSQLRCEGNLYIVSEANNVLLDHKNYYMFSMNDLCRANCQICKFTNIINIYIFDFSVFPAY